MSDNPSLRQAQTTSSASSPPIATTTSSASSTSRPAPSSLRQLPPLPPLTFPAATATAARAAPPAPVPVDVIDLTADEDASNITTSNNLTSARRRRRRPLPSSFREPPPSPRRQYRVDGLLPVNGFHDEEDEDDEDEVILLPNQSRRNRPSRPPRFGRDIINPVDVDVVDLASPPSAANAPSLQRQPQQHRGQNDTSQALYGPRTAGEQLEPELPSIDLTGLAPTVPAREGAPPPPRARPPPLQGYRGATTRTNRPRRESSPEVTFIQSERRDPYQSRPSRHVPDRLARLTNHWPFLDSFGGLRQIMTGTLFNSASSSSNIINNNNIINNGNGAAAATAAPATAGIRATGGAGVGRGNDVIFGRHGESMGLYRRPASTLRQDIYAQTRPLNRRLRPTRFGPSPALTYEQFTLPADGWDGLPRTFDEGTDRGGNGNEVLQYIWGAGGYTPVNVNSPARSTRPARRYVAPSPPPAGFTRNVREDQVVVCPNCDHELGTEGSVPEQAQVWAVKQCGHVYCGLCAHNRKRRRHPNARNKLSKCVVEGCGKSVSSSVSMIQVYL